MDSIEDTDKQGLGQYPPGEDKSGLASAGITRKGILICMLCILLGNAVFTTTFLVLFDSGVGDLLRWQWQSERAGMVGQKEASRKYVASSVKRLG